MLRRLGIALALAAMTSAVLVPGDAGAARDREWLAERMATGGSDGAVAHLAAFDRIAAENGGNRGVGSTGFERSLDYVADRLTGAGYEVTYQDVPYRGFHIDAERATAPDGTGVRVLMSQYGPSTAEGGLTAPLFALPAGQDGFGARLRGGGLSGAGAGHDRPGPHRGLHHAGQGQGRGEAGVAALLLYEVSPAPWTVLRLRAPDSLIPVGHLTQLDAEALAAQAGAPLTVELRGRDEYATTVNLFAETAGGQPDDVVMAGAHLDSSSDGPGVNDNGSSVAAVLEAALRLAPYQDVVPNKVRFAFWGAEELVNIGSHHYVESLTPAQVEAITLYLNYEMLASSNYVNFVMDGDDSDHPDTGGPAAPPGSGQIEAVMTQGYRIQREPLKTADFASMRSDSEAFIAAGIPSGGAHGGIRGLKTPEEAAVFGGTAGQFYDPCYHQSCDDLAHANLAAMRASARAVAWAVGRFAVYDEDVRAASSR